MKTKFIFAALIILTLFSCRKDLIEEAQLIGKWVCVEIKKDTPATRKPSDISFEFKKDSTYIYALANEYSEDGTYYTLDDKLYTTPSGKAKMAVKLGLSGTDTLRFYQNRGGNVEVWTMLRQ